MFVPHVIGSVAWAQDESVSSVDTSLEEKKAKALDLFDQKEYAEVVRLLNDILDQAPSDRDARILLPFALAELGQGTQAIAEGRRALALVPDHYQLQLLLARLLSQQQQIGSETIQLYTAVLKRDPDNEQARLGLAEAYLLNNNVIQALPHYRKLVEVKQDEAFYYLRLGQAYGALGQLEEAKRNYLKAYELDPKNIDELRFLAILADVQDNPEEAIRRYQELLKSHPDNSTAQSALFQLEQSRYEPRLRRPAAEIQTIPLSRYLFGLESGNAAIQGRLKQIDAVQTRSALRFLPSLFFSPSFGKVGELDTENFNFSLGWNLSDLFVDNYSITEKSLQSDLSQIRRQLADLVTSLYYARQTELASYLQLQRSMVLDPTNTQLRDRRRSLKNSIIERNERLWLLSGLR